MKDESSFKNLNDLKTKIEKLISFQEKENPLEPLRKATDENPDELGLLSKYRKVLSCSFVKDTKDATAVKRIEAEKS